MLQIRKLIPLFYFYFFSVFFPQSFDYSNLTFEHLSIEDGLSQITVHAILQDSKGFLWFGTEDGLNRYDGYEFTIYRHDPSDERSISDNFIWSIIEDRDSNIWIGTNGGGLNKYDYNSNSFINFLDKAPSEINNIRILYEDADGRILVGTYNEGLFVFNEEDTTFSKIELLKNDNISIRALKADRQGKIWIGADNLGLISYDPKSKNTNVYDDFIKNANSISVWALEFDPLDNLWIGTYNNGLYKYNAVKDQFVEFNRVNGTRLINNNVTSIIVDSKNNPWISTEGGLSIFDQVGRTFINYDHNVSDLRSLSNSLLRFIVYDKSNLVWIGTVGGGVNKVNLNKKFKQFNHDPTDDKSLSHNMIRAIEEDSQGNIWIGTLGNGMNRYVKEENKFYHFNVENNKLNADVVTSILEDEKRNLWVGTWGGGLEKITFSKNYQVLKKKIFKTSSADKNSSISSNIVQAIYEDSDNNFWIGTENGLDKISGTDGKIYHFRNDPFDEKSISDNRIQSKCIIEDRFGYLWIGTWSGLNRIDIKNKGTDNFEFKSFDIEDGLSENRIISIYDDEKINSEENQILWIGTIGGGLNKMTLFHNGDQKIEYEIEKYTEKDGLPSNVIYGILGDKEGNLWLSTNNGLSKFYKESGTFRNFDIHDGLQSNQFYWGAYHRTKDYEFYFGGINGLNSFYPDQLIENKNIPAVYITKCIFESTDGSLSIEMNSIDEIKNIENFELPYNSYDVRIYYSALDFTTPSKNKYSYILKNYDADWSEETFLNFVQYKNLKDGEFIFSVKGSNNDGRWNNNGPSLQFTIITPFWKAWWFIVIIFLAFAGIIIYFIATQVKNVLAVERLRTKLAADLHDNIGSSLTEISILSEVISTRIKSEDSEITKSLEKISSKSRKLIDKMSDIVWLVNPQRDSLYDLILRLQDTYSDLLSDTEISFRSENLKSLEKVSLSMEHRQHLYLIFKEAINNAINHSKCSEITLNANVSGKTLMMVLKDDGSGFDDADRNMGNGLKNMKNRAAKIGGKLEIESGHDSGTVIKYFGYIKKY